LDFNYGRLRGLIVLIVEDDWLLRQEIFEELTKGDGFILEASTGEYAVTLLEGDRQIDLLITDNELAGPMKGWEGPPDANVRPTQRAMPTALLPGSGLPTPFQS